MRTEDTFDLLRRFIDPNRNNMNKPFSQELSIGRYLCATNARAVILIPETDENKIENEVGYNPPNINRILPVFDDSIVMDFNYLRKLYDDVPIVERYIMEECEACDGAGQFEHWDEWYDCKTCDEQGEIQTQSIEKIKTPETLFKFRDISVTIDQLKFVMEVSRFMLKKDFPFEIMKITVAAIWFKLDDIIVCIAKARDMEEDENDWKIIEVELTSPIK